MIYTEDIIKEIIKQHSCCAAWTVEISSLAGRERSFFNEFLPLSKTALVLGHHVVTKTEWTWYSKDKELEHCMAEDHTGEVCKQLKSILESSGFRTAIVPYPEESGLQFRFVAQAAGAGEIGMNAFLLHPQWGPWIHLRVLATNAPCKVKSILLKQICNSCGICISMCPAGAIQSCSFDGLLCRRYRRSKGEYNPVGPEGELKYCMICADVCPIGDKPQER